jgi:putative flippase GtrA
MTLSKWLVLPPSVQRLLRSALAGGLATIVDLGVLTGLVSLAGWTARAASAPALIVGGVAAFITQKYFAFKATGGSVVRQATQFALVQIGSAVLSGVLYDVVLRSVPSLTSAYVVVRLVTSNLVWLGFSYPLWHFVFRRPPANHEPRS